MSLAKTLSRLSKTTAKLVEKQGTDSFFVLRATKTMDGRGNSVKPFTPTTAVAIPCFYAVIAASGDKLEEQRAAQRKPTIFRRFACASDVDVRHNDRLRLVARGDVPQIDMEIVRVAPLSGVIKEIITVEETPASAP